MVFYPLFSIQLVGILSREQIMTGPFHLFLLFGDQGRKLREAGRFCILQTSLAAVRMEKLFTT